MRLQTEASDAVNAFSATPAKEVLWTELAAHPDFGHIIEIDYVEETVNFTDFKGNTKEYRQGGGLKQIDRLISATNPYFYYSRFYVDLRDLDTLQLTDFTGKRLKSGEAFQNFRDSIEKEQQLLGYFNDVLLERLNPCSQLVKDMKLYNPYLNLQAKIEGKKEIKISVKIHKTEIATITKINDLYVKCKLNKGSVQKSLFSTNEEQILRLTETILEIQEEWNNTKPVFVTLRDRMCICVFNKKKEVSLFANKNYQDLPPIIQTWSNKVGD